MDPVYEKARQVAAAEKTAAGIARLEEKFDAALADPGRAGGGPEALSAVVDKLDAAAKGLEALGTAVTATQSAVTALGAKMQELDPRAALEAFAGRLSAIEAKLDGTTADTATSPAPAPAQAAPKRPAQSPPGGGR